MATSILDLVHSMLMETLRAETGADVAMVGPAGASLFAGPDPQLRLCLVDLRENQKLRAKSEDDPPRFGYYRLDCHYLLFASAGGNKSMGDLLFDATYALNKAIPLRPSRVLDPTLSTWRLWPEAHRDHEFPMRVNPAEGFPRAPEVWTALNSGDRFVSPVYFIVTIPVLPPTFETALPVTTVTSSWGVAGAREHQVTVGGHVYEQKGGPGSPQRPLAAATVILEDAQTGRTIATVITDAVGGYVVALPAGGTYRLFAARPGAGVSTDVLVDPESIAALSSSAPYDLTFT